MDRRSPAGPSSSRSNRRGAPVKFSSSAARDLEAIPLAGRMLYVEPVYTQSGNSASFPVLRHVIALYANGDPSFEDTVGPALRNAIRSATGAG